MHMIWSQIERWLQDVDRDAFEQLREPASNRHMNHLEDTVGFRLPPEMEESYKIHDGSWGLWLFPEGALMTLRAIEDEWLKWNGLLKSGELAQEPSKPDGPIKPVHWNSRWLPLTNGGSGNHYCADLDPADGGTIGQIIWFSHEIGPVRVVASGFTQWLERFASDLNAGRYRYESPFQIVYADESS